MEIENKKIDRRIVKTKKAIANALMDLLAEKDINNITITDVANRADVNRKTIYNYYKSIEDIVDEVENYIIARTEAKIANLDVESGLRNPKELFNRLTSLITENSEFYEKILRLNINSKLLLKLVKSLKNRVTEEFIKYKIIDNTKAELTSSFIVAGMLSVYQDWFRGGKKMPIDELSSEMSKLIFLGVKAIYD